MYVGFIEASEVMRVAEAPAFKASTRNADIAQNILHDPIEEWQRPISATRVAQIASTFDNTGEIMPNPVLLARNAFASKQPKITSKTVGASNYPAGTYIVELEFDDEKPLWILDGQHRIEGLAKSKQKANLMPVVLLLDPDANIYSGDLLAKLFAQVTTEATPLDGLHNEWLTYAFRLGQYAPGINFSKEAVSAFDVAVALCRNPTLSGTPNPFFNQIQFSIHQAARPTHGGFSYTCIDIKNLCLKEYFKQKPTSGAYLSSADVAGEIAAAYSALFPLVSHPQDSVFFGTKDKQHTIMQEAFLVAVLHHLLVKGLGSDWTKLLKSLNFDGTDWDFSTWVAPGGLSGPLSTASKKAAIRTLKEAFITGSLPAGVTDLADYLRGDNGAVEVAFKSLTAGGKPSSAKAHRVDVEVKAGSKKSQSTAVHKFVKVLATSANVGKLLVWDGNASSPTEAEAIKKGIIASKWRPLPRKVLFEMRFYGGTKDVGELTIKP